MEMGVFPTAAEVAELSGAELDHALVAIERARRDVESAYVALLDRADATKRYADDGHASVRGWAVALGDTGPVETKRRLQTMRALRELPETRKALNDGSMGVDHVRTIAALYANERVRDLIVDGDAVLVKHARKGFAVFSEIARRWEQFGDPTGTERRHEEAHRSRDAKVFEHNGSLHIHAHCGTAQGAAILEIFSRQCDAEFLTDWEDAKAIHGDVVNPGHVERTDAQRRMDALAHLFEQAVAAAPGSATPDPLVNLVMTQAEFEAYVEEMSGGDKVPAATVDDIDRRRCETTTGVEINPRDVVIAAMIGMIRRVVIDSAGRVIDLGRKRTFTGAARDAVLLDGRRCTWPGCGRNTSRNEIDHTHPYAAGGLTVPSNGGPACGRHNRWKTKGYTVHRDADGTWHTFRPDGTELTQPAAA